MANLTQIVAEIQPQLAMYIARLSQDVPRVADSTPMTSGEHAISQLQTLKRELVREHNQDLLRMCASLLESDELSEAVEAHRHTPLIEGVKSAASYLGSKFQALGAATSHQTHTADGESSIGKHLLASKAGVFHSHGRHSQQDSSHDLAQAQKLQKLITVLQINYTHEESQSAATHPTPRSD